jgi:hypothetical protein
VSRSPVLEFTSYLALAFNATARVVVPHPLGIADLLHVVDGNLELVAEPAGTGVPSCAAAGPFAVCGDQHRRHLGDGGLRLDVGLDTLVLGDPLPQITEVGGRVVAADWAPRATT